MASWDNKKVVDATTELGKTIAEALRSWAQEVGAGDVASDVLGRVKEEFDVALYRTMGAVGKANTKAKSTAKKATKKASKKVRTVAQKKTTRKTPTTKKAVGKKT